MLRTSGGRCPTWKLERLSEAYNLDASACAELCAAKKMCGWFGLGRDSLTRDRNGRRCYAVSDQTTGGEPQTEIRCSAGWDSRGYPETSLTWNTYALVENYDIVYQLAALKQQFPSANDKFGLKGYARAKDTQCTLAATRPDSSSPTSTWQKLDDIECGFDRRGGLPDVAVAVYTNPLFELETQKLAAGGLDIIQLIPFLALMIAFPILIFFYVQTALTSSQDLDFLSNIMRDDGAGESSSTCSLFVFSLYSLCILFVFSLYSHRRSVLSPSCAHVYSIFFLFPSFSIFSHLFPSSSPPAATGGKSLGVQEYFDTVKREKVKLIMHVECYHYETRTTVRNF